MDKETLSNYGWIVICILVLSVMIALATPFGNFIKTAVQSTTQGLFDVHQKAAGIAGLVIDDQKFEDTTNNEPPNESKPEDAVNEYGFYYGKPYLGYEDSLDNFKNALTLYKDGTGRYESTVSDACMEFEYTVNLLKDIMDFSSMTKEEKEQLAAMGMNENSKMVTMQDGTGICIILSENDLMSLWSDCNIFSLDEDYFVKIDEYTYVQNKNNSNYYDAIVIDKSKTTYAPVLTEVNGKAVLLNNTYSTCKNLTSITIPGGISKIEETTFVGCNSLESITIENGVEIIGEYAFIGCEKLKTLILPASIKTIETATFSVAAGHTRERIDVYYGGTVTQWCNINFSGPSANPCFNGADIYIEGVLLENLTVPNDVTLINVAAFAYNDNLTQITLAKTITNIGSYAFENCNNLTTINFEGTKEEWGNITFGVDWNHNVPATKVICSDGEIVL